MNQLPKQSAYKSSITFGSDGVTAQETRPSLEQSDYKPYNRFKNSVHGTPFKMADLEMKEEEPKSQQ